MLVLIVCIYVDGCIVAGEQVYVDCLKTEAEKYFTIKELGSIQKHLGVWYNWDRDQHGHYLEPNMEDFVEGIFEDYQNLFGEKPYMCTDSWATWHKPSSGIQKWLIS